MSTAPAEPVERHSIAEDAIALLVGTLFVSLGVVIYTKAVLLAGSTAGIALLLQYATGVGFWTVFSLVNLPFYALALKRMGWPFAVKTFACVGLVSYFSVHIPEWMDISGIHPLFASLVGGGMMGLGILSLFRHKASVGGINILALYLQDNFGIRAGYFQLGVDFAILAVAWFVIPADRLALSVLAAVVINMTLAINHRPGRYVGVT